MNPSDRIVRQFAALSLALLAVMARQGHDGRLCLGLALIGAAGLLWPCLIRPVFVGWMVLVFPLGWVVHRLVVALLYFGVLTPLGLGFKLLGRDAMRFRPDPLLTTYWVPRTQRDVNSYFRSF